MTGEAEATPRSGYRPLLRAAISLVVVGAVFFWALPELAAYRDVWAYLRGLSFTDHLWLTAASAWNIGSYLFMLVLALPGLGWAQALVVNNASTAVANTVPAGGAVGIAVTYRMTHSWGFSNAAISRQILVVGIWNNLLKLLLPVVVILPFAVGHDAPPAVVSAAVAGLVVASAVVALLVATLRRVSVARRVGAAAAWAVATWARARRREPPPAARLEEIREGAVHQRGEVLDLVSSRGWLLTAAGIVDHLAIWLVLLFALRFVGITEEQLGWLEVLVGFAAVRLLSALPVTPGGVGVVELGLVALLTQLASDTTDTAAISAAVLVFRFVTYIEPIVLGLGCIVFWIFNTSWRVSVEQ